MKLVSKFLFFVVILAISSFPLTACSSGAGVAIADSVGCQNARGEALRFHQDKHALEVGRKVIKIKSALQVPEQQSSIDAVRELGLDSRYYTMVRGWIMEHIKMTKSYRGTTEYKKSKQRKNEIDSRIAALEEMVRAIDLE